MAKLFGGKIQAYIDDLVRELTATWSSTKIGASLDSIWTAIGALPAVNNGKLTIKKNASDTGTEFTANQSGDVAVNLGLGTMAAQETSNYRTASAQDTIDGTKIDDLVAGTNVVITGTGTQRTIAVPGVDLPDEFVSIEDGIGAVGAINTYNLTEVSPITGSPIFNARDVVFFANGYEGLVLSVNGGLNTYNAVIIRQPRATTWGTIGGTIANQGDLKTILDALSTIANVTSSISAHDANNAAHSDIRALITALTTALAGKLGTAHDTDTTAHNDIRVLIAALATALASKLDSVNWGDIGGSLASQTDLKTALDALTTALAGKLGTGHDGDSGAHSVLFAGKVDKENGKGLSEKNFTATFESLLNFYTGSNSISTLTNIPMNAQTVIANINANQSLTCSGTPPVGQPVHVYVENAGATARTIAIPTTGSYISYVGASVVLPASGSIELSIVYVASKYRITAITPQ